VSKTRAESQVKMLILIVAVCFPQFTVAVSEETCQVTLWADSPVAASGALPIGPDSSHGWYGSEALAALIPKNGKWNGMGPKRNYGDKFWWWRRGFNAKLEPSPQLVVSARRMDGQEGSFELANASSGYSSNPDSDWNSILIGMEFPSAGCWEIIGTYNDAETLKFVMQVGAG
jgi:hypothetical protein